MQYLLARVMATFTRRVESTNPDCVLVRTHESTMISRSPPWNASTVDTSTLLAADGSMLLMLGTGTGMSVESKKSELAG